MAHYPLHNLSRLSCLYLNSYKTLSAIVLYYKHVKTHRVNRFKNIVNQSINMLVLAAYLFVALTRIFFLPNLNKAALQLKASINNEFIHKNHSQSNSTSSVHHGIRSVIESKRKSLVPKTTTFTPLLAFIFSAIALTFLVKKRDIYSVPAYISYPDTYLKLRRLRI